MHTHFLRSLAFLSLVVASTSLAFAADWPDLSGAYQCNGQDVDGTNYAGKCTILKHGDTYLLSWEVVYPAKSPIPLRYTGVGIQMTTGLAVSWGGPKPSVIVYELGAGGTLTGRWVIQGNRVLQPETLVPIKRERDRDT
jgi:hypothetical protein